MYQLLLLYNENRWETGDKPRLQQREGKNILPNQKVALMRTLYRNRMAKVPDSRRCLAGLMQKITELTTALICLIQASVLLTTISSWPLETGSMCLRLHSHLASPGTVNSGQVLLYQAPHSPDWTPAMCWAGGPFGESGTLESLSLPWPVFNRIFLYKSSLSLAAFQAGTHGDEDLRGAEIPVPFPWAHQHWDQHRDVRCK